MGFGMEKKGAQLPPINGFSSLYWPPNPTLVFSLPSGHSKYPDEFTGPADLRPSADGETGDGETGPPVLPHLRGNFWALLVYRRLQHRLPSRLSEGVSIFGLLEEESSKV